MTERYTSLRLVSLACCLLLVAVGCSYDDYQDRPPLRPLAISPPTGSELVINTPTQFSWRGVEDATEYEFHVFDQETGDIERYYRRGLRARDVCRSAAAGETLCSVQLPVALSFMAGHAWRVRAGNVAGWSSWSRETFSMVPSGLLRGARSDVPVRTQ